MPDDGTTNLLPTQNYALFELAERTGQTVQQLVTGETGALTRMEFYLWDRFRLAQARLHQQAQSTK